MNTRSFLAAIVLPITMLAACGGGSTASAPDGGTTQTGASLWTISITPPFPANLPKGLTKQFTATGYYSNGSMQNITSLVAWNSISPTVATIDASGLATGVGTGTTNITAAADGISATSVALTVDPAVLQSFALTPTNATIGAGQSKQLTATGTYSDGSTQKLSDVWWTSSDTAVVTVDGSGTAFGVAPGTAVITATLWDGAGWDSAGAQNVTVTVADYGVSGTLSLLPAGNSVVLQNNGVDDLTLTADGSFMFNTPLATGAAYDVSVLTQPPAPAHPCYVLNGSGALASFYINSVKVICSGVATTFAGSSTYPGAIDGTGTAASFDNPSGVAVDSSGNVYVADTASHLIRKITPAGVVSTFAGVAYTPGATNGAGTTATFNYPTGVAVDSSGNVYVADNFNHLIRKITPAGVVSTLAGSGVVGSANGAGTSASFFKPYAVAVDTAGNVYVADYNNYLIRKITSAGVVSTLAGTAGVTGANDATGTAATFFNPSGIAVDTAGNVYVGDFGNNLVRKITPAGVVTTLAGTAGVAGGADGTGTAATFYGPWGVAVDGSNNVYVTDYRNQKIRKITSTGVVSTLAANGFNPDGSIYVATSSLESTGVAPDSSGNLYLADPYKNMIRKLMP